MPDDEPEPQRHIGFLIRRAQQLHAATWSRIVSTEISSVQYSVLAVLDRLEEASQRELCIEIDLDRSTIADLVARMERRDLIQRHRDPADGRRNTVSLTQRGRAERERLRPLVVQVQESILAGLTADTQRALEHGLRQMLAQ